MAWDNPGVVNVEEARRGILAAGGGENVQQKNGYVHHSVYSRDYNEHLSYDEYPDGSIRNVHTDRDNRAHINYGNGR